MALYGSKQQKNKKNYFWLFFSGFFVISDVEKILVKKKKFQQKDQWSKYINQELHFKRIEMKILFR